MLDRTCPWLCSKHGIYYQTDNIKYRNKKAPYFSENCYWCRKTRQNYLNWINYCKSESEKLNVKHGLWNFNDGYLAANQVDKKYFFTKDKTDVNIIYKLWMTLERLHGYELLVNCSLSWVTL